MNNEQEVILRLIRKAVDSSFSWFIDRKVDWKIIVDLALKQGVTGITFDSYQKIRESMDSKFAPNELSVMAWFGYTNILEKKYEAHKIAIEKLSSFYQQHDIKMMLLKGYGLSKYWPVPKHRPSGDIDIYLYGDWVKGDHLINENLSVEIESGHEHHTCFVFDGESVENHYDIVDTQITKSGAEIDTMLKNMVDTDSNLKSISNVFYPNADFNAIFLIRHLGQHFAGAEATLRQVLDWGFFMRTENKNVNWDVVIPFLRKIGIYNFFCSINSVCVDSLGFKSYDFPFVSDDKALAKRILNDIFHPEFDKVVPRGNKFTAAIFKLKRFLANSWKRKLVYRESMWKQFLFGSILHIRRWETIED